MAGVETIINDILQEANGKADEILAKAKDEKASAADAARKDAQAVAKKYVDKAERDAKDYAARVESQIGLRRRQAALSAKQEIIAGIIEKARKKIDAQDAGSYFDMIEKMLKKVIQPEEGTIAFSQRDLDRMPSGFEDRIEKAAKAAGGKLKLAKEPAKIESGFILSYGGIDENCSIQAMFDEKLNDLQDEVHRALW